MDEAAVLAGMRVATLDDMRAAGEKILGLGPRSLLLKGGHLGTARLTSLFFDGSGGGNGPGGVGVTELHSERRETCNTHGSGCTLSSAIASYLARGESLAAAVAHGQRWVSEAIAHGADVTTGRGNGPLNHFWNPEKLIKN
jgi:hydroxymethylpyrimidine/phosphomethylpyrimidine kinase